MAKRTLKKSAKKATKKSIHKPTAKETEYFVVAEDIGDNRVMSDRLVSGIDGSMEIPIYTDLDSIKNDMMDSDYIAAHPIIYKLVPVCVARKGVSFEIL
jgi:hypothetical protein